MPRGAPRRGGRAFSRASRAHAALMSVPSPRGVRQARTAASAAGSPSRCRRRGCAVGCDCQAFLADKLERGSDQRLAVGPRIERRRRDGEGAAVEVALAQDARYRLAPLRRCRCSGEAFRTSRIAQRRARAAQQVGAREPQRGGQQPARIVAAASSMPARRSSPPKSGAAPMQRCVRTRGAWFKLWHLRSSPPAGSPGRRRPARRSARRARCPPAPRRACAG